jgi:transposase InsO family protein
MSTRAQDLLHIPARPDRTRRARADVELMAEIETIRRVSRGKYGAPRIHADLAARDVQVGRKRVARLMRMPVCGA